MQTMKELKTAIDNAAQILLITHVNPDGDAIGSTLALANVLKKQNKKVTCMCDGRIMEKYAFLAKAGKIEKPDGADFVFDLAIAIDCADKNRMGEADKLFFKARQNANVDHHNTNECFGQINIVHNVSSSGELIYELIKELQGEFDAIVAECLYTAISTDTGNFTYSNTTKKALSYSAEIIGLFDFTKTAESLYRTRTYDNTRLIARAIENMEMLENGQVSLMRLTFADLTEAGIANPDYENLINYASEIDTVKVAIFMRELKDGGYKVSLRSSGDYDVANLCAAYNGGGHKNAAGCTINKGFDEAKQTILASVKQLISI